MVKFLNNDLEMQPFFLLLLFGFVFLFFQTALKVIDWTFFTITFGVYEQQFFLFCSFYFWSYIVYWKWPKKKRIFPSIIKKWIQIKWIVVNKISELKIFEHTRIFFYHHHFFRCKKCRFSGYKTFTVDCCFFFWKASRFFFACSNFLDLRYIHEKKYLQQKISFKKPRIKWVNGHQHKQCNGIHIIGVTFFASDSRFSIVLYE